MPPIHLWYRWDVAEFVERVQTQALDVALSFRSRSEAGTGEDATFAMGFPPDWGFGLYIPDSTAHDGIADTQQFALPLIKACADLDGDGDHETRLGAVSTEQAIDAWLRGGPFRSDVPLVPGLTRGSVLLLAWDDATHTCP